MGVLARKTRDVFLSLFLFSFFLRQPHRATNSGDVFCISHNFTSKYLIGRCHHTHINLQKKQHFEGEKVGNKKTKKIQPAPTASIIKLLGSPLCQTAKVPPLGNHIHLRRRVSTAATNNEVIVLSKKKKDFKRRHTLPD